MIYRRNNKFISIVLSIIMLSAIFTPAFADESKKANMNIELVSDKVMSGQIFRLNVALDFEDDFVANGGIMALRCGLKFDTNVFELYDPNTLQPLVYEDNGNLAEGSKLYKFGQLGTESSFTASYNPDKGVVTLFYGGASAESDIHSAGPLAQFAFFVYDDKEISEYFNSEISLVSTEISLSNVIMDSDGNTTLGPIVSADVTGDNVNLTITPPFELPNLASHRQNTTLSVSGRTIVGVDNPEPIIATISDEQGNVIAEQDAVVTATKYSVRFELDEENYPIGNYKLKLMHRDDFATRSFAVTEKYIPTEIPDPIVPDEPDIPDEPVVPDEPSTDNSGNDNNDGDSNTGNTGSDDSSNKDDNASSGTTKPDNSGTGSSDSSSSNNSGSDINLGGNKLPSTSNSDSKTDTSDVDNKEDEPEILYPSDIDGHWANDNIKYVYDNSLMNGYSDGTFGPDNNITRAEFVTVMARLHGYTEDTAAAAKFTDVSDHWAKGYIGALASMGIVGGVSDTEFAPDENITREQIAAILSRALALTHGDITVKYADDSAISDWAYDSVYSVFEAGYMKGDTANNFNPLNSATRAEVATIIYRLHSAQ